MFVLAFLCLNAGGVFCIAYCQGGLSAGAEHCPRAAARAHCPHSQTQAATNTSPAVEGYAVKCCLLPIGIFAAPIKAGTLITDTTLAPATVPLTMQPQLFAAAATHQLSDNHYRPPPNDKRVERIRNQVFRI